MPSEYCYEYPTRIRKIVIPTSSISGSGLFEIGSLPKIPGRYHAFRIPPPSDQFLGELKSERNLPIPQKPRIMLERSLKRIGENNLDSELDQIFLKPWPILDIPRENAEEDVDCEEEEDSFSDDHAMERDFIKQKKISIIPSIGDLEVPLIPAIQTSFPSDLLELSSLSPSEESFVAKSAFELADNAVSKVWVNPQYEAILKRKSDEEDDSVDAKKRKTS